MSDLELTAVPPSRGVLRGYARVSTESQDLNVQREALMKLGVEHDRIYADVWTGGDRNRPGLTRLLEDVRSGDTVIVTRLDRLARSVLDLQTIAQELSTRGVALSFEGKVYDPNDPVGELLFTVLGAVAQFERSLIRSRTREGMKMAKAKGKLRGRQPKLPPSREKYLVETYLRNDMTVSEVAEMFGVSRPTVYRALQRAGVSTHARTAAAGDQPLGMAVDL